MSGIFDQVINYAPPSLLKGTVTYKGTWSAATNTPTLINPPDITTNGHYYVVSAAGTQFSLVFNIGDWIISNGSAWEKVDNTDAVSSVFGRTGAVVGVSTDYSSVGITATAVGASSPSTGAFTTLSSTSTTTLNSTTIPASKTLVVTTDKISVLAATTSAELAGVISDETGSGSLVFATLPTFGATGVKLSGSTSGTTTVLSGATAGTSVLTLPVATDTLVGKATTDTLTNKTLTSPTITGGALNGTLGATTPSTVAGTTGTFSSTLSASGIITTSLGVIIGDDNSYLYDSGTGSVTLRLGASGPYLSYLTNSGDPMVDGAAGTLALGTAGVRRATITSTGLNSTAIGATTPSTGAFTTGTFSSTLGVTGVATLGNGAILGTPASGTVTNLTGTASININGTVGATTPSTGAFSTLSATGITSITNSTASTSTTTGALKVTGGLGVAGAAFIGDTLNITGNVGIAASAVADIRINIAGNTVAGATSAFGIRAIESIDSTKTSQYTTFASRPYTATAAFTCGTIVHFFASPFTFGVGSTVTSQVGFLANSNMTGATNNWGFQGSIAAASGRYNLYMDGTAQNYLLGKTGIGQAPSATDTLAVTGTTLLTGNTAITGTLSTTGELAIGNTVAAAVAVASTHKVTIVIGGVTYYLLASNV